MTATAQGEGADLRLGPVLEELDTLGPPSEILERAPAMGAAALGLQRLLVSSLQDGALVAQVLHIGGQGRNVPTPDVVGQSVRVAYPLAEAEILRRGKPMYVHDSERSAFVETMAWGHYLAAPVLAGGRAIGLLQADRSGDLSERDAPAFGTFALLLGVVFERAVLRLRLRAEQHEIRRVSAWFESLSGDLSDRPVSLKVESQGDQPTVSPAPGGSGEALRDLLTRREVDVLALLATGASNASIAKQLVVSQGTVKFHVKNILRKLHVSNRAQATARYLNLTRHPPSPSGGG